MACGEDELINEEEEIFKKEFLMLVNKLRANGCDCGSSTMPPVDAVAWNDQLQKAAQAHSDDMFANNHFDHKGTNGSNPGDRIKNAGYNWSTYGENIANGYPDPEAVFNGWKNSPGHCKNMMSSKFKDLGVAQNGSYWTMILGLQK